jgi:GrpB-like predicted nucleotidyltransferase (UPF0157 family)
VDRTQNFVIKLYVPADYQPRAELWFAEVSAQIQKQIPKARVEHIGASSIPGCLSKGDLDILVAVDHVEDHIASIEELGFRIKSESLRTPDLCPFEIINPERDIGIQLIRSGSEFEFFITFRDALREDPCLCARYNEIKMQAHTLPMDEYRAEKSKFIEEVLAAAR